MCLAFNRQPPHHNLVLLTLGHHCISPFSFCLSLPAKQQRLLHTVWFGVLCRFPLPNSLWSHSSANLHRCDEFLPVRHQACHVSVHYPFSWWSILLLHLFYSPSAVGTLHHRHRNVSKVRTLSNSFSSNESSCPKEHHVEKSPSSQEQKSINKGGVLDYWGSGNI